MKKRAVVSTNERTAVEAVSDACINIDSATLHEGHSVPQRVGGQQPRAHPRDNRRENKLSVWEGSFSHAVLPSHSYKNQTYDLR